MTKRAVIVGVDKYQDHRFDELRGAVNDAKEVHAALTRAGDFEISDQDVLIGRDATEAAIRRRISDLLWRTEEAEIALVYFSGHGVADEYRNGFLAPWDMEFDRPFVHGLRMQELKHLMRMAKNKDTILFLFDCCYSGIAADGKGPGIEPAVLDEVLSMPDEDFVGTGRIVLASAGSDERSREQRDCTHRFGRSKPHDHGYFTFQLLEGLDGRAATTGNQEVTLKALYDFVEGELRGATRDQTITFEGVGLQNSDRIVLTRATQHTAIVQRLAQVTDALDDGSPDQFWYAIQLLRKIVEEAPNLDEARQLGERIDERLNRERNAAVNALGASRIELTPYKHTVAQLDTLVLYGNFELLRGESPNILSLLSELWRQGIEGVDVGRFVLMVSANETRLNEEQVLSPKAGSRTSGRS